MSRGLGAALLLVSWSGCWSRPPPEPSPPDASVEIPTPPRVSASPAEVLEIFPPRWRVGDRWRVAMTVSGVDEFHRFNSASEDFTFSVVKIPKDGTGVYRVEAMEDHRKIWYALEYRAEDFSFARALRIREAGERGAERVLATNEARGPFLNGNSQWQYRILILYSAVAPEPGALSQSIHFAGSSGLTAEASEEWFERSGSTLKIAFDTRGGLDGESVRMEWKKGEPWWSTIRCFVASQPEVKHNHPGPEQENERCAGHLIESFVDAGTK